MRIKPKFDIINPKAGHTSHFVIEIPYEFVLVIDTNEQHPLFVSHGSISKNDYSGELLTVRQSLWLGDYSCKGFENEITFEWKTIPDLYGSFYGDREWRKLLDISKYFRKWIVIGGLESEVLRYQEYSKITPNSMKGRLATVEVELGIPIYYARDRLEAERFILYRLTKFFRFKREGRI